MKRIAVLTSSRADFGIYLPLLKKLKEDPFFELSIIAFGTHLSADHGETISQIELSGFDVPYKIKTTPVNDSSRDIAESMGKTIEGFANFWDAHKKAFDLVFCLGDRYEMFSAVMSGVPFQIEFAHIHGGERTLGAIDNIFRHAITIASKYHFTSSSESTKRVKELTESGEHIYNVGALGLDNINTIDTLSIEQFQEEWGVDLSHKTILTTFHPETVALMMNAEYGKILINAIERLSEYQVIITMPNADTEGNVLRSLFILKTTGSKRVTLIENLGVVSYLTAMKYCSFLLGNTSSGIIEASSFGKYVINLGDRQKGRASGRNVLHVPITVESIIESVKWIEDAGFYKLGNLYYNGGAADKIIDVLKNTIDDEFSL